MGPLISPQAKQRVELLIQSGVEEGAKVLLDGRNVKVTGYENGNFVGPTILSNVTVRFLFHLESLVYENVWLMYLSIKYRLATLSCYLTQETLINPSKCHTMGVL